MEKHESNYEITKRLMQARFASRDLSAVAAEGDLEIDGGYLLTSFAGRPYRISVSTGAVLLDGASGLKEADSNVSMTLFDILTRR